MRSNWSTASAHQINESGSHVAPEVEEHGAVLWAAEIWDELVTEGRIYTDLEEERGFLVS